MEFLRENDMDCVKCDGQLKKVVLGEVEVDQCEKCSGIWFDLGELKPILEAEDIAALKNKVSNKKDDDQLAAKCPRCGGEGNMVRVADLSHGDVHIDTCSVCYGQWLDGGELERLRSRGLFDSVKGFFKSVVG